MAVCRSRLELYSNMDDLNSEWQRKGATLSDKTARKEFGLTQDEIVQAIRAGTLLYREHSVYGNPWLRLLRREVGSAGQQETRGQLPERSAGEDGTGAHRPRTKAAEDVDRRVGRAEGKAERRPRKVTASARPRLGEDLALYSFRLRGGLQVCWVTPSSPSSILSEKPSFSRYNGGR